MSPTNHAERLARIVASADYCGEAELDVELLRASREWVQGVIDLAGLLGEGDDDLARLETPSDVKQYAERMDMWAGYYAERA